MGWGPWRSMAPRVGPLPYCTLARPSAVQCRTYTGLRDFNWALYRRRQNSVAAISAVKEAPTSEYRFFSCVFFEFIMESDRSVQEGLFFPLVDCWVNSPTVNSVDWCWKSLTLRFDSRSKKELKLTPCRKIFILPNEGKERQTNFTNTSISIQESEIEVHICL